MLKILHKFYNIYFSICIHFFFYKRMYYGKELNYRSTYFINEDSEFNEGDRTSSSLYDIGILVQNAKLNITQGRKISKEVESSKFKRFNKR